MMSSFGLSSHRSGHLSISWACEADPWHHYTLLHRPATGNTLLPCYRWNTYVRINGSHRQVRIVFEMMTVSCDMLQFILLVPLQSSVSKYCLGEVIGIYCENYTGCPRRNGQNFGSVFLMLNYTDITQNTYTQSWTVTEIMAREVWNFDSCYSLIDYQIHIETGRNMWFL